MKYLVEVKMEVKASSYDKAVSKVNDAINFGLWETSSSIPPKGVTVTGTKVVAAPPPVVGNPIFEVTVVKTAALSLSLSAAMDLLRQRGEPYQLEDYEGDPKQLVEVAISLAEGDQLEPDFDREIFVIQDSGSRTGTTGG